MADALLELANEMGFEVDAANKVIAEADEDTMSYEKHFEEL